MYTTSSKTHILYVEDDVGLARLVQRRLGRMGYAVDLAADGEQGLAMVQHNPYQLLLVDYLLPGIDGLSLIKVLAETDNLPPAIMVSGAGDLVVAVDAMKLGAEDYVIKEPDSGYLDRLPASIERVVERQRLLMEKARADKVLQEAKVAAEKANAAKSHFLASVSHDLRQPLCAATLLNSALARKVEAPELQKIIKDQAAVHESMLDMLNALLELSKLESGVTPLKRRDFQVADLLQHLDEQFQEQAQEKGLQLRIQTSSSTICSDPSLLERILQNFLSNAIKYTDRGKILVGCRRQQRKLRLEVWDTGTGIPADQRESIFEAFYQLGNSVSESYTGLGLGLSIVDQLAKLLDHSLDVKSVSGQGSMFAVEVPLAVTVHG